MKTIHKIVPLIKRHSPQILAGVGIVLEVGACIFSAAGALKAEKLKEKEIGL